MMKLFSKKDIYPSYDKVEVSRKLRVFITNGNLDHYLNQDYDIMTI